MDIELAQLRWQNVSRDDEEEAAEGEVAREEYERAEAESEREYANDRRNPREGLQLSDW